MIWREIHSAVGFVVTPERYPQSTPVTQNHKAVEQPERYRRQHEALEGLAAQILPARPPDESVSQPRRTRRGLSRAMGTGLMRRPRAPPYQRRCGIPPCPLEW